MNKPQQSKLVIYNHLLAIVESKIKTARQAIASAKEARDNDTKSSAGDKFETGRAMMQIELDKNQGQLSKAINLKNILAQINIKLVADKVVQGSLVTTNQGIYFISIGIGKIEFNNNNYYAISLASPIGILLANKQVGETIEFRGKQITINNIE